MIPQNIVGMQGFGTLLLLSKVSGDGSATLLDYSTVSYHLQVDFTRMCMRVGPKPSDKTSDCP